MEKLDLLAQRIDGLIQELNRLREENHFLREEGRHQREEAELRQMLADEAQENLSREQAARAEAVARIDALIDRIQSALPQPAQGEQQ